MAQNQQTSAQVAAIANRALQNPSSLSHDEIRTLAASVQGQSSGSGQQSAGNNQQGQGNEQAQRK
jgi:hypothetical protein